MADSDWARAIPCEDGSGRQRDLTVYLSRDARVVVSAPPGESGILDPRAVEALKQALTDAQVEAIHRRRSARPFGQTGGARRGGQ